MNTNSGSTCSGHGVGALAKRAPVITGWREDAEKAMEFERE